MKLLLVGVHERREDIEPMARAIPSGPVFLSVMEVPDDQPAGDRPLLLRTLDVRGQLLERATFLAVRYGFFARSEEDAVARTLPHVGRWLALLQTHGAFIEMSLKVVAATPREKPDRKDFTSGAAYLRSLHEATRAADTDPEFRRVVEERITSLASEHRWIHRDSASLELALLVDRNRADEVAAAAAALKAAFPHVPFLLSGPWPIEVFADDYQQ